MAPIISLPFGFIELVIALRFVFLLLGVRLQGSFVAWIYNVSHPLVAPFGTVFGHTAPVINGTIPGSFFESASLVALVVYAVIGGVLLSVVSGTRRRL